MISDYVRILGAKVVEVPPGEHSPVLTREMAEWISDASLSVGRILGGGRADPRVYANAQRVIVAISRFSARNVILPATGGQFATFSYRQLARELGLSPTSTESVQRAVRLLGLRTVCSDGDEYVEACKLLRSGLDGTPLLRRLYKSDSPRLASAWEPVGIRPLPYAEAGGGTETTVEAPTTVAAASETAAANPDTVTVELETVAIKSGSVAPYEDSKVATISIESTSAPDTSSTPTSIIQKDGGGSTDESVARGNGEGEALDATTSFCPHAPLPSNVPGKREIDGYSRVISLFKYAPGKKDEETRRAYANCVEQGYSADSLAEGIAAYFSSTPREEQARFPITFISDMALVMAWCKKPPRKLNPELLRQDADGFWLYPFSTGASTGYVECCRDASREEAFEAVERMVREGKRCP